MLDDTTAAQVRELATRSRLLEAEVRNAILRTLRGEADQVVGAREILDLAEAFGWITSPGQSHGGSAR